MSTDALSRLIASLSGRSVVLLQGPVGPFFRYLADALIRRGARVIKVNFNAGDRFHFGRDGAEDYVGTAQGYPAYFEALFARTAADAVFVFGDQRAPHQAARAVAQARGIALYAFEEGYLRPDYITLEVGGVNARSTASTDPEEYQRYLSLPTVEVEPVGSTFWDLAMHSASYGLATYLGRNDYPGYVHHKDIHPLREAGRWVLGGYRKLRWKARDLGVEELCEGPLSGRYFLVPLQVFNDFQIRDASFASVPAFMEHVCEVFARTARSDEHLFLKHHPMDRPYRDYTSLVETLRTRYGLGERLHYIADSHLPTLLRNARGTICINSTVGLSSLHHGTPVFATDPTPYTRAGLTFTGSLAEFIRDPGTVDRQRVRVFEAYLRHTNQIGGSFYRIAALPLSVRPHQRLTPPGGVGRHDVDHRSRP